MEWWGHSGMFAAAGGDPYFANVSLLLHGEGANGSTSIINSAPLGVAVTANNGAAISTADFKYGASSIFFNGIAQSLTFADPQLGTGDFTIECFFKTNSSVQYAQIIGNEIPGILGYSLLINNNSSTGGQVALYIGGGFVLSSGSTDWSDNAWHYLALVRSGNNFTLMIDGSLVGSGSSSLSMNGGATSYVGRNNQFSPRNLVGYIDELRITKSVARNVTTVPTAAFPDF